MRICYSCQIKTTKNQKNNKNIFFASFMEYM